MKNWKYVEGAKVGNYTPNYRYKGFLITNPEGYEFVVFLQDGIHVGYRGTTSKAQAEDWCDWHDPKTGKPVAKFRNSKTGNIAADITTDGNTWFVTTSDGKKKEFPSEREAEEYVKKIKTGNGVFSIFKSDKPIKMKSPQGAIVTINPDGTAAHQDKEGSQMAVHPHNSFKEAVEYYKSQGYVKVSNESLGEYMAKKPRVINEEKTGAEEFFKKLSDDVKEREDKDDADIEKVSNREVYVNQYERTKAVVYEDGTIMLWDKNGNNYKTIKAGSLEEARKKLNSDYKKVGNANLETSVEKGKLGLWNWYVHKDGTIVSGGTSSTETNAKEMARKALEKEKAGNKVGNARYTTREDVISHLDTDLYDICKKMPSGTTPWAYLLELQKKGWDMNTISKYSKEIGKIVDRYKAGNAKTGNKKIKFTDKKDGKIEYVYDEESKDGHIYYDGKLVDTKKAVGPGWVDLIKQKAFSSGVMNKTGNAAATFFIIAPNGEKVKAIDYDQWHYKCVDTGELVEKRFSKRIGNSASDKLPTAMDYRKALDEIIEKKNLKPDEARRKYGQFTYAQWEKELGHKIGNAFTSSDKKRLDELARKKPTQLTPQEWKEFQDLNKREEEASREMLKKFGNSASDDKFAYVMREFDEGKLKTPDGKVVTDPAQAKAIAYSESKKTENGLARARNAMNPIKYKGYTIRFRPNSQKYYISSGPGDTYVREYAYKEYASEQDAKDAIDHLK